MSKTRIAAPRNTPSYVGRIGNASEYWPHGRQAATRGKVSGEKYRVNLLPVLLSSHTTPVRRIASENAGPTLPWVTRSLQ